MKRDLCKSCKWLVVSEHSESTGTKNGFCHLYPPGVTATGSRWTVVNENDFCGQHKASDDK